MALTWFVVGGKNLKLCLKHIGYWSYNYCILTNLLIDLRSHYFLYARIEIVVYFVLIKKFEETSKKLELYMSISNMSLDVEYMSCLSMFVWIYVRFKDTLRLYALIMIVVEV